MKLKLVVGIFLLLTIPLAHAQTSPVLEGLALYRSAVLADLSGEWEMEMDVRRVIDNFGDEMDYDAEFFVTMEIEFEDNTFTGTYIDATESACPEAEFEGTISGTEMSWIVTYSGDCCPTAQIEFTGSFSEGGRRVEGEMTPIGLPPEDCWIWWADVTLTRQ